MLDMQDTLLGIAARLTDDELLGRVRVLATREREATVELVAHLAELDARKLHLAQGYGSLFSYCTEALRLAEHAAYNRIEAARASRKFPVVLNRLADGSLNLSSVRLLAPHLTPENHESVLLEAARKSKREVEALVARLAPRPDVPPSVRKLPPHRQLPQAPAASAASTSGSPVEPGAEATSLSGSPASLRAPTSGLPAVPPATSGSRPLVVPLSPQRYRVQFTVGRETQENLRRAQDLLRREIPDGDPGQIFDRALKLLLEDIARKKLAATSKPRPKRRTAERSRHIPAHAKRAVWLRDGGQCAFVARSGRRCRERALLAFHHVDPYAIGGGCCTPRPDNRERAQARRRRRILCSRASACCGGSQPPLDRRLCRYQAAAIDSSKTRRCPAWTSTEASIGLEEVIEPAVDLERTPDTSRARASAYRPVFFLRMSI
jgi:hypothetical protein